MKCWGESLKKDLNMIFRAVRIIYSICPSYTMWQIFYTLTDSVVPFFNIYMSAEILNKITEMDRRGLISLVFTTIIGNFMLNISTRIIRGRANVWEKSFESRSSFYLMNVQNQMEFIHFEEPEVRKKRENIIMVQDSSGGGLNQVRWISMRMVTYIANILTSMVLLMTVKENIVSKKYNGFLSFANSKYAVFSLYVLLIIQVLINSRIISIKGVKLAEAMSDVVEFNSKNGAYNKWTIDMFIHGLNELILEEKKKYSIHPDYLNKVRIVKNKYNKYQIIVNEIQKVWLYIIVVAKVYTGVWGMGNYILYQNTIEKLLTSISGMLSDISVLINNNKYLENLYSFLDLSREGKEMKDKIIIDDFDDYIIEFKNVSFKYPSLDSNTLENINISIRKGDKVSIIGENGSGKTTFLKLMCRLYKPSSGKILLNGKDIWNYSIEEYQKFFSTLFQDFQLFSFSIADNVAGGAELDIDKINECIEQVGLESKMKELKNSIFTFIHHDFEKEGTELSGGESQRLALSRSVYKDAPIFVFDEPNSALDSEAEYQLGNKVRFFDKDKSLVIITHRMSICKLCSRVIVFDKGRIVQTGTHSELIKQKEGKYYEMWKAQSKYYCSIA